jgi:hypothetical protein
MDSLRKRPLLAFIRRRLGADQLTPEELNRARWNRAVEREVARERQVGLVELGRTVQRPEWQAAVLPTRRPGS